MEDARGHDRQRVLADRVLLAAAVPDHAVPFEHEVEGHRLERRQTQTPAVGDTAGREGLDFDGQVVEQSLEDHGGEVIVVKPGSSRVKDLGFCGGIRRAGRSGTRCGPKGTRPCVGCECPE